MDKPFGGGFMAKVLLMPDDPRRRKMIYRGLKDHSKKKESKIVRRKQRQKEKYISSHRGLEFMMIRPAEEPRIFKRVMQVWGIEKSPESMFILSCGHAHVKKVKNPLPKRMACTTCEGLLAV